MPEITLPKGRLGSIDLLRGAASLAVVFFHAYAAYQFALLLEPQKFLYELVYKIPVSLGYTGVYLFFVISGFCIHLRWAKAKAEEKKDFSISFVPFWKRRFVRLYPAYLATIFISLIVLYLQNKIEFSYFFVWDIISHLLMIHNLDVRTTYSINGVLWTIAIEEQLYLAYFLLLWLRIKFGWKRTLTIVLLTRFVWFGLALKANSLFNLQIPISESALANWFIWTLGTVGIEAAVGIIKLPKWCYSLSLSAVFLFFAGFAEYLDYGREQTGVFHKIVWLLASPMWGTGFFLLVNNFVRAELSWVNLHKRLYLNKNLLVKFFVWLGVFSYSLYLTHEIILRFIMNPPVLAIMICIFFAFFFYFIFEKPFIKILKVKS